MLSEGRERKSVILARFVDKFFDEEVPDVKNNFLVRNPTGEDILPLTLLFRRAFENMGAFYRDAQESSFVLNKIRDPKYLPLHSWIATSPESKITGACLVRSFAAGIHNISVIAVAPEARHQGIGSFLLKKVLGNPIEPGLEGRFTIADVTPDNKSSLSLFKSAGFVDVLTVSEQFTRHGCRAAEILSR